MKKAFAITFTVLMLAGLAGAEKSQGQSSTGISPSDILQVLQAATTKKVQLSKDDLEKIAAGLAPGFNRPVSMEMKSTETVMNRCNNNRYLERAGGTTLNDAARECGFLGEWGLMYLGPANGQVELAMERACALPRSPELQDTWKTENYCAKLGDLYKSRGELAMAIAVYEHAPNCQGDFGRAQNYAGTRCAVGVILVQRLLGNTSGEASEIQKLCSVYTGDGLCPVAPAAVASQPRHPARNNPFKTSTAQDYTFWTLSGTAYMADGSLALGGDKRLGTVFVIPLENSNAFNDCISNGTDIFNCAVGSRLFSMNTEHDGSFGFQVNNDMYELVGVETVWNSDGTKTESVGVVTLSV
ncbi:MAG: hypothetical protein WBD19_19535, partial [Candidatus Acidiferrum sp.]